MGALYIPEERVEVDVHHLKIVSNTLHTRLKICFTHGIGPHFISPVLVTGGCSPTRVPAYGYHMCSNWREPEHLYRASVFEPHENVTITAATTIMVCQRTSQHKSYPLGL